MAVRGDLATEFNTCACIYQHGGGATTLITLVETTPGSPYTSVANQYSIALTLNVFSLVYISSADKFEFVAIDSSNRLYQFKVGYTGVVSDSKISQPMSILSSYAVSGTLARAAYAESWDYYLFGKGTSLTFPE
jgi:hypothetical protein